MISINIKLKTKNLTTLYNRILVNNIISYLKNSVKNHPVVDLDNKLANIHRRKDLGSISLYNTDTNKDDYIHNPHWGVVAAH